MSLRAQQFWDRYHNLESRIETMRKRLPADRDARSEAGQLRVAQSTIAFAGFSAQSGALGEAYGALSFAEQVYNAVFTRHVLPDIGAAENRQSGGSERGRQQSSAKQEKVDRCQRIAGDLWANVPESRRPFSSLRYKRELAPRIREQYRREGYGEPPARKWITGNIIHPEKNPRS
jgi:hypothetical protein